MRTQRRSFIWWLVLGGSLCLLGCLVLGVLIGRPPVSPTAEAFAAAHRRWTTHQLPHYHLLISRQELGGMCRQSFDVQQEQVIAVLENTCVLDFRPPASVSELFAHIEPYVTPWTCGPNGCHCGRLGMDVTYDPVRGYPQQATLRHLPPRWEDQVGALAQGRLECTLIGVLDEHFEVLSLTARP
jgi:hypothetical protein